MNRKWRSLSCICSLFIAIVFVFTVGMAAFGLEPFKITEYVTDRAGILSENDRSQIASQLADYADATGNQILVVTIPSLEGEDLIDFTEQLFTLNKPGQKGKDNGLILLIAQQERQIRIEVGYGLEGPVPDGKAGAIIREQISPYFKAGDFYNGIFAGVNAIIQAITPEYNLTNPVPSPETRSHPRNSSAGAVVGLIIAFIILIFGNLGNNRRRRFRRGYSEPWFWGGGGGRRGGGGFGGFGGGSSGGGGFGGG
ncbi:MAG TPA: TPM domain-containing protein, partial [Bacillota bacterium]|nr:TPM domain-containing protein [Bacillota bacterium]